MDFGSTKRRLEGKLRQALREAEQGVPALLAAVRPRLAGVNVRFTLIDATALEAWRRWDGTTAGAGGWNWSDERAGYEKAVGRFELAIWGNGVLCGLALGDLNGNKTSVRLKILEGNPDPGHPLKDGIRFCVVDASVRYANIISARELRLIRPVEGAIPLYEAMGFSLNGLAENPPYCSMEL